MLRALVDQLWMPEGDSAAWPVRVTQGTIPPGHRLVESYAVVPDTRRPRFLVPLDNRAVASNSLIRYNRLREARLRLPRAMLGMGFRTGLGPVLLRHRLLVCVSDDVGPDRYGDYLLSAHLRQVLGAPKAVLAVGVRPPDPNLKPTLQLFGPDGSPVGYAKVGWNAATREMVTRESAAVSAISREAGSTAPGLHVPRLLHHGRWRDYQIAVTAPLPMGIRRHQDADRPPPPPEEHRAFAARMTTLAEARFWRDIRAEVATLEEDGDERRLAALATARCADLERDHGTTLLRVGRWHGDWVPWNMGWHNGELHVWDWEHSATEVPVGFDHLHWRFQVCLVLRGRPLADAVAAVHAAAGELTRTPPDQRALLGKLYLLEMFMRTYRLKRLGGGWNAAIYPAMLQVLEEL